MTHAHDFRPDVAIVLCGQAGTGINTVEHLLVTLFKQAGYWVFATKEYMSRVRGGQNSTTIRISSSPVRGNVQRADILVPLNKGAIAHVQKRLSPKTLILADQDLVHDDELAQQMHCIEVPLTQRAKDIGNILYSNIVAVGLIVSLFGLESQQTADVLRAQFAKKD